jgi:Pyrimidine deaminase
VNYFERALELAKRGRGKVNDHPIVGAVLVANGEIVGEGWYEYDRVDHAETIALAQAGDRARRDALRHARAVRASRTDSAVRRCGDCRRRRARRDRRARSEPEAAGASTASAQPASRSSYCARSSP